MSQLRRGLARVVDFFRRRSLDRDLDEELQAHLDMAAADYRSRGLSEAEAMRQARVDLGGVAQLREARREVRGLPWLDCFLLDLKLAVRRLRKSWGLSLVSVLAMTVAIGLSTVVFAFIETVFWPKLPLPHGGRIVAVQTWHVEEGRRHATDRRDFDRWRDALETVEEIGAFRSGERQVAFGEDATRQWLAEISASAFRVAGTPPLLGRTLVEADESASAPPVAVLGWDLWSSRFAGDTSVLGEPLEIGGTSHTIVGVMPRGFAFPVNHSLWIPLRSGDATPIDPGPYGTTFARLDELATRDDLQAELSSLGTVRESTAEATFDVRAMPYTYAFTDDLEPSTVQRGLRLVVVFLVLLLLPPCANVAVLVYARIAARREEFAARFALGAGRSRIVAQLFTESLALSAVASALALAIARLVLARLEQRLGSTLDGAPPFWMDFGLSLRTTIFAVLLGVVAATVAGLWPALQATGRRMRLGSSLLGSRSVAQLGATWTFLVVVQVGASMAVLPSSVEMAWGTLRASLADPGIEADRFLTARLLPGDAASASGLDLAAWLEELRASPLVDAASASRHVPGSEAWSRLEVETDPDSGSAETSQTFSARINRVHPDFLETLEHRQLLGRGLGPGDFGSPAAVAVIDQRFAARHFAGVEPLGRRVRARSGDAARWWEIVGIVDDLPSHKLHGTLYVPALPLSDDGPADDLAVTLRLQSADSLEAAAAHLRSTTAAALPGHRLDEIRTLEEIYRRESLGDDVGALVLLLATAVVLLLSAAGMSALAAFTVQQRRHEIGVRAALGGQSSRLLYAVFRRAGMQLLLGALVGAALATFVDVYFPIEEAGGRNLPFIVPAAGALLLIVGLTAVLGPARRALRLEPVDVLRQG